MYTCRRTCTQVITYHHSNFPESVYTTENNSLVVRYTTVSPESSWNSVASCSKTCPTLATVGSNHVTIFPLSVTKLALKSLADKNFTLSPSRPSSTIRG